MADYPHDSLRTYLHFMFLGILLLWMNYETTDSWAQTYKTDPT